MSKRFWGRAGGVGPTEQWEARLRETARSFSYPPAPDIAGAVRRRLMAEIKPHPALYQRGWIWATLIIVLILGGLLSVPQVRAAVVEFIQIGVIRIFLTEPTPTPTVLPATPGSQQPTPNPSPTPLRSVLDLAGETSLAEARKEIDFPIRLPTYPPDLGEPDHVFVQDLGGQAVVLVWMDSDHPGQVRLSLHQLGPGTFAQKGEPRLIHQTTVHGQTAWWTEGPYVLQFRRGNRVDYDFRRLVQGRVLLWVEAGITYRLETDLPLEEAVRVAEGLE